LAPLTGNNLVWIIPVGALTGGLAAAAVGYFIFYGRISALQGTILTYTLTLILWTGSIALTVAVGDAMVGGDNGMTSIPALTLGFGSEAQPLAPFGMYVTVLVVAAALYLAVTALLRRPFGLVVEGIRMDELKTELLGYDVRGYRLVVFVVGGAMAGIAGGLFGSWATYINPTVFGIAEALLVPIYVLVGGRGTLVGAFIGAVLVGALSFWLGGGVIGGQTTLALGAILILLVLFLPGGVIGTILLLARRVRRGAAPAVLPQPDATHPASLTEAASAEDVPALETAGLTKTFGGVLAIDDVSLKIPAKGIRSLIGPNGAGKSTLLKLCAGLHRPQAGRILLNGVDITQAQPFARVRAGLAIKMQVAQVYRELTVLDNLWLAAYARFRNKDDVDARVGLILPLIGLSEKRLVTGAQLSHGERQWLDIGMVLCLAPKVILLDEPTAGMTPEETRQTTMLIRRLAQDAAVVIIAHDMQCIRMLDAEVTVLHQGQVFANGVLEDLRRNEGVLDIYLGRRQSVKGL
jgi:branched-chain amino acid transport system permease protein